MRFVIVATLLALALSAKVKIPTPEMNLPDVSSIKQYLSGFTEVLDIDVSDAGLKKCAKADIHFTKTLIPIIQTLREKKYQEAIQQFVAQIKNIKQDMKDCSEIGKGELEYFGKVWKNLKEHSVETVETVAMNIAVHKDDLRKSAMKVGQLFMTQKFKQAGKTYGKMILQVFDGVDQKDAEFFNISSKKVTKTRFVSFIQSDAHKLGKFNVTVGEENYKFDMDAYMKNATKMIADYMRGISDGLEFGLTKKYINKCAKSNTDFFSQVEMPFIKLLKERNYLEAIEELVKDIPEIKKFWGDCKDYNLGFYKHILVPLANEFKHDPLGTVETVGLNIIEQFSELNETAHQVGQHFMNRSFYKAGKDYAKLVHLVLDGAINNRKPKNLLRIPKEANETLFNLTDIQKKYLNNATDFLNGFSVGMGLDLSHKQLKTCQKANFDMSNNILSISEFIRRGEYVQLLESLAEDVTKFENDISGCRPLFQAQVKKFYIPVYESFKMHPMDTLKTLGLNILENFKTINSTMRDIGHNIMNHSFYQAGLTEADLLHIIFKDIIPDQDHDTFFDIKTTNYTNFTLPNITKIQVQVMRGEADALGLDITRHEIQKCAAANVDMNNMMIPLFKALHDQDFAKFLLDLARDFKDFENDVKDCKEWGQAWYNGLIGPIVESFEDDAVETLKTIGLNVLENFKELRDNGKSVGVDARKQDFYEVGKDVGQIIATIFNGIAH